MQLNLVLLKSQIGLFINLNRIRECTTRPYHVAYWEIRYEIKSQFVNKLNIFASVIEK